ncbi:protein DGS1, mitochondrial-like isoform X3 [Cucurbita pepo subsp. pepo]|uniref:protein DGS1, mitochondrial-like isoform X3 n=1 Tax=Cucurbita pepo subsp. pepo TaxID=3664 RepID=UPI000C9D948D|nr:protein DGS1, mitochondrial-like isoform X3 [Cucurbita pepo subsp. pepo]
METTPEESEDKSITTSISQHSLSVWRRILAFFPLPRAFSFLWKLSGFPRRRSRKIGFPLPQRLESINSSVLTVTCLKPAEASRLYDVLDDILEHCFLSLYNIWKNLQFWQSRAEVFMNTDNIGTDSGNDLQNPLPSLLVALNGLFLDLETSICELHTTLNMDFHGSFSFPLFKKLPDVNKEGSQWTSCEIGDAINLLCQNFHKLDNVISIIVLKHRKPKKLTRHWLKYTCGAIGLSVCSVWLLQHSKLMGSNDIENWVREAHNSAAKFFKDHVQQPLISIRDELFATFRKRHKGIMDGQDVQLTTDSLRRMLHAFSEHTEGRKFADAASDEEMFAKVMFRYEKELKHPVQNLLSGELARALLIQVQKLKLDIETAMLELDQILKANEINFAVLAALPAFFISLLLLMLLRAWYMQDTRAEGKGRAARLQRRLLVVEVEKAIMQYQSFVDQGHVKNAESSFGLLLYSLGRLYHASEKHAKATGEWLALRQDLLELGKPSLPTRDKLIIASRIERIYDCLLPASTRL